MRIKFFINATIIVSLLPISAAFAEAYPPAKQTVFLKFPNGITPWHIDNRTMTNQGYMVTLYPPDQDHSTWVEAIRMKIIPYEAIG